MSVWDYAIGSEGVLVLFHVVSALRGFLKP